MNQRKSSSEKNRGLKRRNPTTSDISAELFLIATLPLLLGSTISLAWDNAPNWIFACCVYAVAFLVQQQLFGAKHFDQAEFGVREVQGGLKEGIFLFGDWVSKDDELFSENRKLIELSKISFRFILTCAQVLIIGSYLLMVFKTNSMEFRFITLIHFAAAIYFMMTTHKGQLFLALLVNLGTVILSLRNLEQVPSWAKWATIPYAIMLIHTVVNLQDFDLKQIFDDRKNAWNKDPRRLLLKTRRVIADLIPLFLVFLLAWHLIHQQLQKVERPNPVALDGSKLPQNLQRFLPRQRSIDDIIDSIENNTPLGQSPQASQSGAGESPAGDNAQLEDLQRQMKALENPDTLKRLGHENAESLKGLMQQMQNRSLGEAGRPGDGSTGNPNSYLNDEDAAPSGQSQMAQASEGTEPSAAASGNAARNGGSDFAEAPPPRPPNPPSIDEDELKSDLAELKQNVASDPSPPKDRPRESQKTPNPGDEDDLASLNKEIRQQEEIRNIMKNFGNEPPLKTLEKLQKLKMESPKRSLEIDPENPEINEYAKNYAKQADELVKKFTGQGTTASGLQNQGKGSPQAGHSPAHSGASSDQQTQSPGDRRSLPPQNSSVLTNTQSQKSTDAARKPFQLPKIPDKLIKLLPWIVLLACLFLVWKALAKLLHKSPANQEEDRPVEIDEQTLNELKQQLRSINHKNLSPEERVIASYNLSLNLMQSLNWPKPEGLPAEDFPGTFTRTLKRSLGNDFNAITEIFSQTFYGKLPVESASLRQFDTRVKTLFQSAEQFAVQNVQATQED